MFVELLTPIGNSFNNIGNIIDVTVEKQQKQSDKDDEKTKYQQYNAETKRMNAQAKLDAIAYANRLADMSQQQGRHIANVAGDMQLRAGGPYSPVQITPQGVQIPPQPPVRVQIPPQ